MTVKTLITAEQLRKILPAASKLKIDLFINPLNASMNEFGITSLARITSFISQIGHESGQLQYVKEIWGPTPAQRDYEGRKDLGNTQFGDGKFFMGRGLIQITGRANYAECSKALFGDDRLLKDPRLLESPLHACRSAAWFWSKKGLNQLADAGDQVKVTKRINGGTNGLKDRLELFDKAREVLA